MCCLENVAAYRPQEQQGGPQEDSTLDVLYCGLEWYLYFWLLLFCKIEDGITITPGRARACTALLRLWRSVRQMKSPQKRHVEGKRFAFVVIQQSHDFLTQSYIFCASNYLLLFSKILVSGTAGWVKSEILFEFSFVLVSLKRLFQTQLWGLIPNVWRSLSHQHRHDHALKCCPNNQYQQVWRS